MRIHLLVWTLILGLGAGLSVVSAVAKDAPKKLVIKDCQKSKPPVAFPHEEHVKKNKIACKTCHHKEPGKACGAAGCHAGKAEGKRPGCQEMNPSKNPFHITCIGCHKKQNKGPKACAECHKK